MSLHRASPGVQDRKTMKWEPSKINFYVLMTLIAVGIVAAVIYSMFTPTLEECLVERANEDISDACWNLLLQEGR